MRKPADVILEHSHNYDSVISISGENAAYSLCTVRTALITQHLQPFPPVTSVIAVDPGW